MVPILIAGVVASFVMSVIAFISVLGKNKGLRQEIETLQSEIDSMENSIERCRYNHGDLLSMHNHLAVKAAGTDKKVEHLITAKKKVDNIEAQKRVMAEQLVKQDQVERTTRIEI